MLPDMQQRRDGDAQQLGNTVGTRHPTDVFQAMTAGGRVEPRYRMIGGMGLEPLNSKNGATRVANVQTAATAIMAIA